MVVKPRIIMTENTLMPRLMAIDSAVQLGIRATLSRYEPIAEARLKERAPWTDRTGNARNGLAARAVFGDDVDSLVLFHQVPYGIYLETKNSGKYAVIIPVVNEISKEIMGTLRKMMSALGAPGRVTRS